jgi:hypothetical protein
MLMAGQCSQIDVGVMHITCSINWTSMQQKKAEGRKLSLI